ncbi:MAG: SDR family oxidoreductase [Mesorhizobium sp.]|nr:MAG: SDR family oxidoreductase [Mesorhizobium sp.]
MKGLAERVFLVTGGASGIGAACVRRLVGEGACVAAGDLDQNALERSFAQLEGKERIYCQKLDVTSRDEVETFVTNASRRFGKLHGLINCAGIRGVGSILDFDPDTWKKVLAVNLNGTFNMCQFFARAVKDADLEGKVIVNISAGGGIMGVPNRLAYVASKFAISGITRSMGVELAPFGIRVNAVAPGMTRTALTAYMFDNPENIKRIRAAQPMGREADPSEIAAVAVFLLTDDASFMTGAVVSADGGQTACTPSFPGSAQS